MKNKKLIIAVAGLVVLICISYGLYYMISRRYNEGDSGTKLAENNRNEELNPLNYEPDQNENASEEISNGDANDTNTENGNNSDTNLDLQMGASETIAARAGQSDDNQPAAQNNAGDGDIAPQNVDSPAPGSGSQATNAPTVADTTGTPAADFTVYDANGNAVKLSSLFGRPIVLNFWASWCNPCKSEMPYFQSAYESYGSNVQFVMVNLTDGQRESKDSAQTYIRNQGYSFPVYFDSSQSAVDAYSVYSIPKTYFISSSGRVVNKVFGSITQSQLKSYIQSLK